MGDRKWVDAQRRGERITGMRRRKVNHNQHISQKEKNNLFTVKIDEHT